MGLQLLKDDKTGRAFQLINVNTRKERLIDTGLLDLQDYQKVIDFFQEFTGKDVYDYWGNQYEQYGDAYYELIHQLLSQFALNHFLKTIPSALQMIEHIVERTEDIEEILSEMLDDELIDLATAFHSRIQEEILQDLLTFADLPFDMDTHENLYAAQLAEIERKKQEEAKLIEEVFGREYHISVNPSIRYVLHVGETNTGKTHHALMQMMSANSGLYLGPLRLLALEVFEKLNNDGIPCSLKTGEEEKLIPNAQHLSCTVEMFHEKEYYDCIVIDEAQMITDKDRGFSWYKAITRANAKEVHIIGSFNMKEMMIQLLGEATLEIHEYRREIPLEVEKNAFRLKDTKAGDAIVCFSRKRVLETAAQLQKMGHRVSVIYGSMPPETRKRQIQAFIAKKTKVIVSTDAIGMGLNLPIRRIVFLENEKFDGIRRRHLTSQEIKQIAGRAGRKGMYDIGKVAFTGEIPFMKRRLEQPDDAIQTFSIAPTNRVLERFQVHYRDLDTFFELWKKYKNPKGTKKAELFQEKQLYQLIKGSEIEARFSLTDLYGFLHLPFSIKDEGLTKQWLNTMKAIVMGVELPEPRQRTGSLDDLELAYKAIGLHLLFLYKLGLKTEAEYWERVREEISVQANEHLKREVRNFKKACKQCGKKLTFDFRYPICESCYASRSRRSRWGEDFY